MSVPWLGIWYQNITESMAAQLRLPDQKGVVVMDVVQGSQQKKLASNHGTLSAALTTGTSSP